MLRFGIPTIDDEVGWIPDGSRILISAAPGIDLTPFGAHIAVKASENGMRAVYLTNNKPGTAVRREFDFLGFRPNGDFVIVDAFSGIVGLPSQEKVCVGTPFEPASVASSVRDASDGGGSVVIVDSISSMIDVCGMSPTQISGLVKEMSKKSTVVALFSNWHYGEEITQGIAQGFDAVVNLWNVEEITTMKQMMAISNVGWKKVRQTSVPIKVLRPGGLRVYVPKILVTGPYNAGKSSMTRAISTSSVSVDRMGTTVAMDHGYLDYNGFATEVFGTPGQEMFDPLLAYLADEAVGIILVVDSTAPGTFPRAKDMLARTRALNLPLVVAANHSDKPGAKPVEEIRAELALPDNVPILRTVATAGSGIRDVLDKLMKRILEVNDK
ncbi:MAG: 50S ribosome-binding GTPase [Euryarchaeota archaeon]|nr:50S ribosome-binding GTPase [Euryarchaeota archaeon]